MNIGLDRNDDVVDPAKDGRNIFLAVAVLCPLSSLALSMALEAPRSMARLSPIPERRNVVTINDARVQDYLLHGLACRGGRHHGHLGDQQGRGLPSVVVSLSVV